MLNVLFLLSNASIELSKIITILFNSLQSYVNHLVLCFWLIYASSFPFGDVDTTNNSLITSKGNPLVSGTLRKINIQETALIIQKNPKTPVVPKPLFMVGNRNMINMFAVHVIITHRAKQIPLTLVGNISKQKMFATAPNPILKAQNKTIRPTTEIPPWTIPIEAIYLPKQL